MGAAQDKSLEGYEQDYLADERVSDHKHDIIDTIITVAVKPLKEEPFVVQVKPDDSVESFKAKVKDKGGFVEEQRFLFNGKQLEDGLNLSSYNIQMDSVIYMVPDPDTIKRTIFIQVKVAEEKNVVLKVKPDDTVVSVKAKIEEQNGTVIDEQILLYNEKELENDRSLADYDIHEDSSLVLRVHEPFTIHINGKTFSIRANDSIKRLKEMIQVEQDIPVENQILLFNERVLASEHTLADYAIPDDSTLTLLSESPFMLFVKTETGKTITLRVTSYDSIGSVKAKIQEKEGKPIEKQIIVFRGKKLLDDHTLKDYEIRKEYSIHVIDAPSIAVADPDSDEFEVIIVLSGRVPLTVNKNDSIKDLKLKIQEKLHVPACQQRPHFGGMQLEDSYKISDFDIFPGAPIRVFLCLSGGKPVILFYPPTTGAHANVKSFNTTTTVTLHNACRFTTLLPRPKVAADGQSITWNALISRRDGIENPASLSVNGREHSYLFWECGNKEGKIETAEAEFVSSKIGYKSVIDHLDSSYLIEGMEEYEEFCESMLETLGLGVRERDDFMTFWAREFEENGPIMIARVIPERDLGECAELSVEASESGSGVRMEVNIRRVYISMIVSKSVPKCVEGKAEAMRMWREEKKVSGKLRLSSEICSLYPIEMSLSSLTVIEWGGILLKM